jgi:hypothetical protein
MHELLQSMYVHMKHYFRVTRDVIGQNLCALQITRKQIKEAQQQDLGAIEAGGFF